MFLMNSSPLVALQRKWEAFAPARNCRYPVCFSESEDDISRNTVTAKVQMIINNLQSEEASLGTHSEYGCLVQRKQKGAKGRGHKVGGGGGTRQKCIKYTQLTCPADSDGMEVEENSEFGPLLLNSDSDDSVDRDIEEAIQEYLKNKGQSIEQLPSHTKSSGRDRQSQQEHPSSDALCHRCPVDVNAGAAQYFGEDATGWASSPCSVSSDDSFEQSIKTEIEQFLNEKKQHTKKKNISGGSRQLDPKGGQEKLAVRSRKDGTNNRIRRSLKHGGKALFLRRHPELGGTGAPKGLKSKASEEPPACKMANQADFKIPLAGYSTALEPNKGGEKGQYLWKARGEQRHESVDLADSSSDDGIEEAIQLYQLEKIRRATDCKTDCLTFRKEEFRAGGIENLSSGPAILSVKSALPEIPRKVLSSNRKCVGPKPAKLNQIGGIFHNLERSRSYTSPRNSPAKCADMFQASCRADTAAELMCAEAILDISKTILPPPAGSDNRTYATNPFFCSQDVPPSQYENDSNAVDSDDSIEQEIQAFLAVKAQTEHLITNLKGASFSVQFPSSSEQPDEPIRNHRHTFQKPLKMSLAHKRKLKRGSKIPSQSQNTPLALPEMCYSCADNICSTASASLEEGGVNGLRKGDAAVLAACQQNTLGTVSSLPPERFCSRNHPQNTTHTEQKCGAGDKSSSLDSDEDLDTAIKDLLRSKRKLKKKSKDQRIPYKKKVRFGNTEMHIFEDEEREYESKTSASLKSCLMSSKRTTLEEDAKKASPSVVRRKPKRAKTIQFTVESKKECQAKPSSGPEIQETENGHQCLWTPASLTNDSSSIDSDDSIEQEIRRFLAEKAKDSSATMEPPAADDVPKTSKPQVALDQAKCTLGRGGVLLEPNKTGKEVAPPAAKLSSSLGAGETGGTALLLHAEGMSIQAMRRPPANQGLVQTKGPGFSAKRTVVKRKVICDQRSLPSEKDEAGSHNLHNYLKSVSPFKRRSSYGLKISSKLIGVKSTPNKKKSILLGKKQSIELSLFRKQGAVPVAETLGERCAVSVQTASLSSKTGVREAEGLQPRMPERNEKVAAATSHGAEADLAQVKPLGDREPCHHVGSSSGPSLQEHKADDASGIRTSPGPSHVQVPIREEGGELPEHGSGAVPRSTSRLLLNEKCSPGRIARERSTKVVEAGAAACTDSAVVECVYCLARSTSSSS
ncbi:protein phosphatase 1 regulatory subunit 26 [Varanus komodoensis]|uniref:Protein phosphatase 1 regulatory subunit 26 n=1 Tax=Varanus komodoensis TaxID=61221 RepID=A0A8D2LCV0_VARKO|nr:protein phosphatase 1 regulatory subunit 26 [Varanus komodoensis]